MDSSDGAASDDEHHVVISGMSGRLPRSRNLEQFRDHLFAGTDMVTEVARWPKGLFGMPGRYGLLEELGHFDASFFGVHPKQAHVMDPQLRIMLEATFEAIVDAGVNPRELRDSRTGVFVGACNSESEDFWMMDPNNVTGYVQIGCARSMLANRISFFFDFKGPSCILDAACASSVFALQHAFQAISSGQCDSAIVGGCSLCLKPGNSLDFFRLNMLSREGKCKAFDASADGYVKSEAVVVMFLQKKKVARRIYTTIVNARTNTDGAKLQGVTFPSGEVQEQLIIETYKEVGIDPADVVYIEAHGTGTKAGDPEEVNALTDVFCKSRKGPLLVGSTKSNMGHAEPASGLCSLSKIILAMEAGMIPGNLHYSCPNLDIHGLIDGRLKVVDKNIKYNGGLIGLNSFGFGGVNVHVILESNQKTRPPKTKYSIPRLVVASGRTHNAVSKILTHAVNNHDDAELHGLIDRVHDDNIQGHNYRGYAIFNEEGKYLAQETMEVENSKRPLWFIFSGLGSQCPGTTIELMQLPLFRKTMEKCAAALHPLQIDLMALVKEDSVESITASTVIITATQVALVTVLKNIGIEPDGFIGHSMGEIGCAYADGTLTLEQTILMAYWRGRSLSESTTEPGAMAVIGLSWEKCEELCPAEICLACHNSSDNVTIAGPLPAVQNFVNNLALQNIFTKMVNSCGIPCHCRYVANAASELKNKLEKIIPEPKQRSSKWISSSFSVDQLDTDVAKYSSADYHVHNLLSPVLFAEAMTSIPENAIVLEIAPHSLLQALLKRGIQHSSTKVFELINKRSENYFLQFLSSFGKLYAAGLQPKVRNLYEAVSLPVSRGTPMLGPQVEWDHTIKWDVANFGAVVPFGQNIIEVDTSRLEDQYILGHAINGQVTFPSSALLVYAWDTFAKLHNKTKETTPVVVEDVQFMKCIIMPDSGSVKLEIEIQRGTGEFNISERGALVVTGKISILENDKQNVCRFSQTDPENFSADTLTLNMDDIYNEFDFRGYEYDGSFRGILQSDIHRNIGKLKWTGNWITFIDTMLQYSLIGYNDRQFRQVKSLEKIIIDPTKHLPITFESFTVHNNRAWKVINAGAIEITGIHFFTIPLCLKREATPKIEKIEFIPFNNDTLNKTMSKHDALSISVQIVLQNVGTSNIKVIETVSHDNGKELLAETVLKIVESESNKRAEITVAAANLTTVYANILKDTPIRVIDQDMRESLLEEKYHLALGIDILTISNFRLVKIMLKSIQEGGMLIAVEYKFDINVVLTIIQENDLYIASQHKTCDGDVVVLRKRTVIPIEHAVVHITNEDFKWVEPLKTALKVAVEKEEFRVYLVSENVPQSGIMGLTNCLLLEPGGNRVRLFYLLDCKTKFDPESEIYLDQVKKDLTFNVMKSQVWGSYRHLLLTTDLSGHRVNVRNAYIDNVGKGDPAVFDWIESPLENYELNRNICQVFYTSLNCVEVDLSKGRYLHDQAHISDLEFSGRDDTGQNVMGIAPRSLATSVVRDDKFTWNIPEDWTLEDASTVPVAYALAYFALVVRGRLQSGERVLVHIGCESTALAAVAIAVSMGCSVFVTASTEEQNEFLIKKLRLSSASIGSSFDTKFQEVVLQKTNGLGVDLMLTTSDDDVAVHCVRKAGRILEIKKFYLFQSKKLGLAYLNRSIQYQSIQLEDVLNSTDEEKFEVTRLLREGIQNRVVHPLRRKVYNHHQIQQAIRYLECDNNNGKVIIKMCSEENQFSKTRSRSVDSIRRIHMYPMKSYIITGGLGGMGMELAQWLLNRGATKIVLNSRTGVQTGYQSYNIQRWRDAGVKVHISTANMTTPEGSIILLEEALKLGPIGGIFNLAVVVIDSFLENQTESSFRDVSRPKYEGTKALDAASRMLAPDLDHFVVFSSITSGRGLVGQTNYGLANSAMERICELRKADNLPGLAVQFGPVGKVGILKKLYPDIKELMGCSLQNINSCLDALATLMTLNHPVVTSCVMADKRAGVTADVPKDTDIVKTVAGIFGIKDISKISGSAKFSELGMDSVMMHEINLALKKCCNLDLFYQDIRALTFDKIRRL